MEKEYKGMRLPGLIAVLPMLLFLVLGILCFAGIEDNDTVTHIVERVAGGVVSLILAIICLNGMTLLEPNESCVLLFLGNYRGTLRRTGFTWINPFLAKRKLSLRVHNLDIDPIKVNDLLGNPILIGMVLVWKIDDTYAATFDIDNAGTSQSVALANFVNIQGDAALREVAGKYAYDNDSNESAVTLRDGGDEINQQLEEKINDRLRIAGIKVVEARINYLAYAPEIAAAMLRRQQAGAIIAAREKIVEGAVTMVEMALESIEKRNLVELTNEKRADIVANLLMVLCSEDGPQTVIPTRQ